MVWAPSGKVTHGIASSSKVANGCVTYIKRKAWLLTADLMFRQTMMKYPYNAQEAFTTQ